VGVPSTLACGVLLFCGRNPVSAGERPRAFEPGRLLKAQSTKDPQFHLLRESRQTPWKVSNVKKMESFSLKGFGSHVTLVRPHYGMAELDSPWRVPVVQLAPMVGRHNEHAAQASLQERLMVELVDRRVELIKYGGAKIIDQEWRRMAEEVGLPYKMLPALLERWQHTAEDGEAFLEKNGDHYLLATTKPYRAAREFLIEAGRRSLAAKESGKKGVLIHVSHIKGQPKRRNKTPKK
jgi:hypothetical protein